MKKWKIIKGTEEDFKNCPDWVRVVYQHGEDDDRDDFRGFVSEWVLGADMAYGSTTGPDSSTAYTKLDGYFEVGYPIAERVEVEEEMSVTKGWLVNGKFTEDDQYANWASKHGYEVIAIKDETKGPDILDIILKGSIEANPRPVGQVLKHLNEEVGEVGETLLLIAHGALPDELVEGEVADVILCAVDLLFVHVKTETNGMWDDARVVQEVKDLIEDAVKRKTEKWISKSKAGDYD